MKRGVKVKSAYGCDAPRLCGSQQAIGPPELEVYQALREALILRGWPILALERLNRDFSEWRHRTAPKLEFQ